MPTRSYDVAIIGGCHNSLVCAACLALGGASVVVLEKNDRVGGAALTEGAASRAIDPSDALPLLPFYILLKWSRASNEGHRNQCANKADKSIAPLHQKLFLM